MVGDGAGWSLSWDAKEIGGIARRLGISVAGGRWITGCKKQAVFYSDNTGY